MFLVYTTKIESNSVKKLYFDNKLTYKRSLSLRHKGAREEKRGRKGESELHNKLMLIIYI